MPRHFICDAHERISEIPIVILDNPCPMIDTSSCCWKLCCGDMNIPPGSVNRCTKHATNTTHALTDTEHSHPTRTLLLSHILILVL